MEFAGNEKFEEACANFSLGRSGDRSQKPSGHAIPGKDAASQQCGNRVDEYLNALSIRERGINEIGCRPIVFVELLGSIEDSLLPLQRNIQRGDFLTASLDEQVKEFREYVMTALVLAHVVRLKEYATSWELPTMA